MARTVFRDSYLAFGIIASIISGVAIAIIHNAGVDMDIATTLALVPITAIAFSIYNETISINQKTLLLIMIGLLLGIIYYNLSYSVVTDVKSSNGITGYIFFFVNVAIVIPIFEELVVRRLLFFGLAKYIRPLFSALVVSVLFSIAHTGAMFWAFVCSLCLCGLAYRGVDTINRAAIHGAFNASLGALWILGWRIHW